MRRQLFTGSIVAIVAATYFAVQWWRADVARTTAEPKPDSVALVQPPAPALAPAEAEPANRELAAGVIATSREELRKMGKAEAAFLAEHGETATNLLALFTATGEARFLARALELFPNDPAVLYVALDDATLPGEQRRALIERFKAADPQNPLPWIHSAADYFEQGRRPDAVEELREALKRPGFYTYFTERADALRALALQSGLPQHVAEVTSYFAQTLPHMQLATKTARHFGGMLDEQIAAGDALATDHAKLLYDFAQMFQTPEASRLLIGELVGVSIEKRALDAAAKLGSNPLPVDPATRQAELLQLRDEIKSLTDTASRINNEPDLWGSYASRLRKDGEKAALQWVAQQPTAAAAPSAR